jgi:hypothetical protein
MILEQFLGSFAVGLAGSFEGSFMVDFSADSTGTFCVFL